MQLRAALLARIILWLVVPNALSSTNRGGVHHDHLHQQILPTPSTSTSPPRVQTNDRGNTFRLRAKQSTAPTTHTTTQMTTNLREAITNGTPIVLLLSHSRAPIVQRSTVDNDKAYQPHDSGGDNARDSYESTPDTTLAQPDVILDSPENVQIDELSGRLNNDISDKIDVMTPSTTNQDSRRGTTSKVTTVEADEETAKMMTSLFPGQAEGTTRPLTREFVPGGWEFGPDSADKYDIVKKIDGTEEEKQRVPRTTGSFQTEAQASTNTLRSTDTFPGATSATVTRTVLSTPYTSFPSQMQDSRPIKVHKKSETHIAGAKERGSTIPTAGLEITQQSENSALSVAQDDSNEPELDPKQSTQGSSEETNSSVGPLLSAMAPQSDASPEPAASPTAAVPFTSPTNIANATTGGHIESHPARVQNVHGIVVKVAEEPHDHVESKLVPKNTQQRVRPRGPPADTPDFPRMLTDSPLVVEPEQESHTEVGKGRPGKPHDVTLVPKGVDTTTMDTDAGSPTKASSVSTGTADITGTTHVAGELSTAEHFNVSSDSDTTVFYGTTDTEQTTEDHDQDDCLHLQTACTNRSSTEGSYEDTNNDTSTQAPSIAVEKIPDVSFCITVTLSGTWDRFCTEIEEFRRSIADVLSLELRPDISPSQIVIEDNCSLNRRKHGEVVVRMHLTDTEDRYSQKLTALAAVILHHNDKQHVNMQMMNVCFYSSRSLASPPLAKKPLHGMGSTGVIASITISAIAGTSLFLISVLLVVMRQRIQNTSGAPTTTDALSLASFKSSFRKKKMRQSLRSFLNEAFDDNEDFSKPVSFNSLPAALSNKDALEEEFKRIPMNMARVDDMPPGVEHKNRYANVIPISETKVHLNSRPDDDTSDYINANFVRGYKGRPQRYIACQAPLPETTEDFWRMIWEQQCKVILMLTTFEENGVQRCAPYFPTNTLDCHKLYGDYQVTLKSKDVRPSFTFSTLKLHHLDKNLCREVYHCWYTAWPPQGVPEDVSSVVTFLLESRQYTSRSSAPIVVHCSPGTGRTGTVLAIDICMQELADKHRVDVPKTVFRLRQDRGGAVQTKDQYAFIYEALYDCSARLAAQSQRPSVVSAT